MILPHRANPVGWNFRERRSARRVVVHSCTWLVVCHADQIDLDQRILDQQAGRTDGRARWRDFEIFLPHLVEAVEVVEIGEKDLRLDDLVERTSGCFERLLEIFQDKAGLQLDVRVVVGEVRMPPRFRRNAASEVTGELARREDESAGLEGFGIVCERLRCARLDRLLGSFAGHAPYQVDLDQRVLDQEASRTDRRARGWELEILLPHLIEAAEIVEVSKEDLGLENIVERAPSRFECLLEVFQDVAGLQFDVGIIKGKIRAAHGVSGHAGLVVAGDLPRGIDEIADLESLVVVASGRGAFDLITCLSTPLLGTKPIRSISTSVSLTRRPVVPTVVRAGGTLKYSFHTSSKAKKSLRSVRKTCALKTLSSELPAASKVFFRFSRTKRV